MKAKNKNMRTNLRATLLTLAFSLQPLALFAADLQICTSDLTTRILPGRLVTLTPASTPAHPPGWLTLMTPWTGFTGTNGCVTVSNLLGGAYRLTIAGTPITSLPLAVPTNAGLVNAWFCLTNATLPASNAPAAYTTTAADALFATKTLLTNLLNSTSGPTNGLTWLQASNAARDIALALDSALSNALAFVSASNASYQSSLSYSLSATSSNIAGGGFQINSNRIGRWDDGIWGTIDDGTSSDGVERMIFLNAPGVTTDSSGITGYRMLFFNGPYLGDPGAFMPLTNSSMTSDDAAWLHDVRSQIFTNGALLNAPSNMLSLDTAQNISAVKTLILSNRIVLTGAGAPGANGTYSNLVKDATWLIYVQGPSVAYVNSNGYSVYRCDDGSLTNWAVAVQPYYLPLPSARYGGLTLDADPVCTNCPVLWRDSLLFLRTNEAGGTNARVLINGGTGTNITEYGSPAGTNYTRTDTNGFWNTNTAGGFVNIRQGKVTAVLGGTTNSFTPNSASTPHPRAVFEVGNSTSDASIGMVVRPNYSTVPGKRAVIYACTRQDEATAASQIGMQTTEGGFSQIWSAINQGDSYGAPPLQFLVDGLPILTARTNGTMPEVDLFGCLIVTNHIRAGTNLTMMTALASPTVTGTNNGIMWASNNTLFWTWTAGGTTTNTAKIAGP